MAKLSAKVQRRLYLIAIFVLSAILLTSTCVLGWYIWQSRQEAAVYDDLEQLVNNARPTVEATAETTSPRETQETVPGTQPPETTEPTQPTSPWVTVIHPETGEEVEVLPEYAQVFLLNPDMVGWMSIEGTDISYPVMQTKDYPDYYLHHDFNKEYSLAGCLYAEEDADVFAPSDNVTVYGHRMTNGSMFAQLINYSDKSFWEEHPYIQFDTLTERHTYQIAFVFKTTATLNQGFPYHRFVDAYNENAFNAFVLECGWNQFYETGVEVVYGDKLITLSTCEYSQANGRFVVVAKRIS